MTRFEVRRLAPDLVDDAATLLAARHSRHRRSCPALDVSFEDAANCAPLIASRLALEGSIGAIAYSGGTPRGYVLMTPRSEEMWGPNSWAEDDGNAGDSEAIREAYALIAGDLVDAGKRGHWAIVPTDDAEMIEGWFSLSFGVQHDYAFRAPVGSDFQPQIGDGLVIRRPTADDIPALADLDLVLPNHLIRGPVFSKLNPPSHEEVEAELADDLGNAKYSFWVAEHHGRVVATLVGTSLESSSSWGALMRPQGAGLLAFASTLPEARGLGAGRALTQVFLAWARDEGYQWLSTDWRSANLEANRTWRAMGFEPAFYRLFRSIP